MVMKVGQYIGVIMVLAVFLTANAIQYTHDVTHDYDCSSTHHSDHEHPETEECALCWFVFHQMASPFIFGSLLPEVAVQELINLLHARYQLTFRDGIECSLGNKDPPLLV